jgi:hypothetical protein
MTPEQSATNLFLALDKIGVTALSDDDCCMLMAWFGVYGCLSEESVCNWKLNKDIRIAQQRLNMFGGQVPNGELLEKANEYKAELSAKDKPDWCLEIERKYKIQIQEDD